MREIRTASQGRQPSRAALAARSWRQVEALTGAARREAIEAHFRTFPPINRTARACTVRF